MRGHRRDATILAWRTSSLIEQQTTGSSSAGLSAAIGQPQSRATLTRTCRARGHDAERIYLFGSAARGEADDLSDVDLVIIKQTTQPWLDRMPEVARLLPADVGGVDALVYTPEEFARMLDEGNAFAQMIAEEGWVLYERQAQS